MNDIEPQKILLIRPSALGDVCRSVAVLSVLRKRFPRAELHWLVQDTFVDAVREHPALGRALLFPRARFHAWWSPQTSASILRWLGDLRAARYDVVIDAQGLLRSGIFALSTGARVRVGYRDAAEGGWVGVNRRVDAPRSLHTVDRMLRLVDAIAATSSASTVEQTGAGHATRATAADLRLYSSAEARAFAAEACGGFGPRVVLMAPTSRWPGKQWPSERFASVARSLLEGSRAFADAVVVVGGASERGQCEPLLNLASDPLVGPRVIDLVGKTSIAQLMALVERSSLVIANDSAALHMAVGFDRPLLALYGPTRVELVGPYGRETDVLQHTSPTDRMDHKDAASGRALMERIGVSEVLEAAVTRLGGTQRSQPHTVA